MSSPWLWYFSRAAGVVTLTLVTVTVVLGLLTSARWNGEDKPDPAPAAEAIELCPVTTLRWDPMRRLTYLRINNDVEYAPRDHRAKHDGGAAE
ncbi:hypothetical protein [Nocardia aurantiaca]|uniref:Uncharacterized protein n=1 Tax=Nocardia aurantiaca TaxID=2675850 RepID=A0A6I3L1W5_9NOCA|nr:hypothetical protein [Nocardia aurantiaca]MTE16322.1 hypothetical protein [Nocardia aurantiaca]